MSTRRANTSCSNNPRASRAVLKSKKMSEADKIISKDQPFLTGEKDDFKLVWLNDGTDYPALLDAYFKGELEMKCLAKGDYPARETYLVEALGRKFIFKRIHQPPERRKRHIWDLISGTAFSRLMRETRKAIDNGCTIIPEAYLIAEKFIGYQYCIDSYLITEFIEGEVLKGDPPSSGPWITGLAETVGKLHDCGLASGAPHPWNLVKTDEGMKMIDISFKGPMVICQAHDTLDVKRKFDIDVPIKKLSIKIFSRLVFLKYDWHMFRKNLKKKFR
ncbi:hypothetical protein C4J81_18195 [Deltaproteobacteria bacterium Smac51]|nr:hypothetical protein C4J81_18195 [Deltaproteobacteria bacterium Smac51]